MGTAHVFGLAERWDPHTEETANAHRSRNGRDVSVTESQTSTSRPSERSYAHKRTMLGAGRRAQSGSTHRSSAASTSLASFSGGFSFTSHRHTKTLALFREGKHLAHVTVASFSCSRHATRTARLFTPHVFCAPLSRLPPLPGSRKSKNVNRERFILYN